jgi:hypothetical protein
LLLHRRCLHGGRRRYRDVGETSPSRALYDWAGNSHSSRAVPCSFTAGFL